MFNISMDKDPAQSLLYVILAVAGLILSATHYWFGQFEVVLPNLIINLVFFLSAFFLLLNRNKEFSKYFNILSLAAVAILIQYQLSVQKELSFHWLVSYPVISFMLLPISWALTINISIFTSTAFLFSSKLGEIESFQYLLLIFLVNICALGYAVSNQIKRDNLLKLAVTDYQSGAYNQQHLTTKLQQEVARSKVTNRTLSLLAVTIEDHHQIMEIHGRSVSDGVLHEFKDVIYKILRAGDEVFHNGSGTFYILLPNCPIEGVTVLKERLMKTLELHAWSEVGELQLNTGVATLNFNESANDFLQRASQHVIKQQQTSLRLLAFDNQ